MNNAEFLRKLKKLPVMSSYDIPEALRENSDVSTSKVNVRQITLLIGSMTGFIILAIISGFLFSLATPKTAIYSQSISHRQESIRTNPEQKKPLSFQKNSADSILGHFAYREAPMSELVGIYQNGQIKMRQAAAQKLQEMLIDAKTQGVNLVPISGFRTIVQQEALFFGIGAQRNQTPAQRAAVSAPPKYSEHHTGYALDIGDGSAPVTNLTTNFEKTTAFRWLENNAARYGFELSFPRNNLQGLNYEPWHWRFVGNPHSFETFYKRQKQNIQTLLKENFSKISFS